MNFFESENDELHNEHEQLKRQKSAKKLTLDSVDFNNQTGKIKNYDISLEECTCVDFFMRQKPCKHMYKLASELGVFKISDKTNNEYLPASGEVATKVIRDAIKEKIRDVSKDAQIELREFTYNPKQKIYQMQDHRACEELISAGLLIARNVSIDDALKNLTIADIRKLCSNEKPKKSAKRAEVIDFFKKNYYATAEKIAREFGEGKMVLNLPKEILDNLNAINRFVCSLINPVVTEHYCLKIDVNLFG